MAQSGIDPHYHDPYQVPDLEELGVKYLGGGDWQLPVGAEIESLSSDDWMLTLADGTEYRLWSQEDAVGAGSEDLLDIIFSSISPEEMQGLTLEEISAAINAMNSESGIRSRILSREEIETAAADIYCLNRETKPFEEAGIWWQDDNIKLIRKGGSTYALHGWTGRQYADCWKCGGDLATEPEGSYTITPVYNQITDEETELVDYEIEENL